MSRPIDRSRPRWWGAKLRLADVRDTLRELAEDEDWNAAATEALEAISQARPGQYDWLAIQRESGVAQAVTDALREAGSRILEGRRGRGRPTLDDTGETTKRTIRLTPRHEAEIARMIEAGWGPTLNDVVRHLIERSADNRSEGLGPHAPPR